WKLGAEAGRDGQQNERSAMSVLDEIEFFVFHHHHYAVLPPDMDEAVSTWVTPPARWFDAKQAHRLYEQHLRTIVRAEELGFDGICISEHHQTVLSMTPSASLMAARVATATSRVRIQVAGVPINLTTPNRLAEEYAMLDVMSGGRMEFGFPLGTGMEYWGNSGAMNPTSARAKFRESIEILLTAWTADEPVRYEGDF